jgi:hypothetical protein
MNRTYFEHRRSRPSWTFWMSAVDGLYNFRCFVEIESGPIYLERIRKRSLLRHQGLSELGNGAKDLFFLRWERQIQYSPLFQSQK